LAYQSAVDIGANAQCLSACSPVGAVSGMLLNLWKNERPAPTALPGEAKSTSRARLNIAGISDPI